MSASVDFAYPWWLSYGHVVVLVPAALLLALAVKRRWPKWAAVVLTAVVLWSGASLIITRFIFNPNASPPLPTESFLRNGTGRVLDIGAGTGRSSIMVLRARPEATLVAVDLFGESFQHHFGHETSPRQRLQRNLDAAGVFRRASIETADMRQLPFGAASFDAVVSAYAIDHLNREGSRAALREAARVVKPGGDFLLMLVANDLWAKFAFGPVLSHGGTRSPAWWSGALNDAGFDVLERGSRPLTMYFLGRRN